MRMRVRLASLLSKIAVSTELLCFSTFDFSRRMVHENRPLDCSRSGPAVGQLTVQDYKDAVRTLNSLQSNINVLESARKNPLDSALRNVPMTISYLAQIGISVDDLDQLNIIHVSGTKGKGSTCAFCENILRKHGLRTGFFSSPHIVAVRERIRINGQPLSESVFATYFSEVYDRLFENSAACGMPPYFKFLTIMAFHTFLKEKVDVAIIEVGIGGQHDCTNVVRRPVVCGVTSLGLDHTQILGRTIDKIAWQKAGIFKPGVPAVTVKQSDEAMKVLLERSTKIGAPLTVAPDLESHAWHGLPVVLGLAGEVQRQNAALAVQLVLTWWSRQQEKCNGLSAFPKPNELQSSQVLISQDPGHTLMNSISWGLRDCWWPGRHQVLNRGNSVYFLDGAHTPESMQSCAEWFNKASNFEKLTTKERIYKVLLFNSTGDRSPESLLTPLLRCNFDFSVFCTNAISKTEDASSDAASISVSKDQTLLRCELHRKTWHKLVDGEVSSTKSVIFSCISDALVYLSSQTGPSLPLCCGAVDSGMPEGTKLHVLVVGSLHLVGGVLSIFDPELEFGNSQNAGSNVYTNK